MDESAKITTYNNSRVHGSLISNNNALVSNKNVLTIKLMSASVLSHHSLEEIILTLKYTPNTIRL